MKPPPFDYVAPRSLDEAVAALAEHGDEAKVMAGGQSLVPLLAFRLARPSVVVDVNRVAGLDGARLEGDTLELGALTRQRDVELLPGRYTVVGTREGYRDVRREVVLPPGAAPAALTVRCEEPI